MEQEKPKSKIPTKEEFVQHMLFHGGYLGGDRAHPREPDYYVSLKDLDADFKEEHPLVINDPQEFEHFRNVVTAFYNYKHDAMREVDRMKKGFEVIGEHYRSYLKYDYNVRIKNLMDCIEKNHRLLCTIIDKYECLFKFKYIDEESFEIPRMAVSHKDISKMRSTIRQFVREWSKEGAEERNTSYKPIIEEFMKYFPKPEVDGRRIKVLVPGSGLGRLPFDFASKGYDAQGNEFSYFMLFCANFILNSVEQKEWWEIHPYIHTFNNIVQEKDPFGLYKIPDILPSSLITSEVDFSMVAGEFVEVYKMQKGQWDSVATCFFIDTAHNIVLYIETIWEILRDGGVWINLGPLLYHYAEMEGECSIELSWDEIEHIILKMGFEIQNKSFRKSSYCQDPKTMMKVEFDCIFFTAVKKVQDKSKQSMEVEKKPE